MPWDWRIRYVLYRYGPKVAYFMLGLGFVLALLAFRGLYERQDQTAGDLAGVVTDIQRQRRTQTGAICAAQNDVTLALRALIVNSAKQSKNFDRIYRQFGLPPYKERLRLAERQAAELKVIPCDEFIEQIEQQIPPPPKVSK